MNPDIGPAQRRNDVVAHMAGPDPEAICKLNDSENRDGYSQRIGSRRALEVGVDKGVDPARYAAERAGDS